MTLGKMLDCRIISVEQGSDEWLDLRRTRITCSRLGDVMAKPETKRYKRYREEKVQELLGKKQVEESPEWAQHGKENEGRALSAYEYRYGVEVEHNAFLISNKYDWLSCSPDLLNLPDYQEGGEIKCRALYKNYRKYRRQCADLNGTTAACPAENRHQVQGAMWVTGFKRWFFINYYIGSDLEGGMAQKVERVSVPRDDKLIAAMEERCVEFMTECYETAGLA
jgi:hypothetical protein